MMGEWFYVPVNIDPHMTLPKPVYHIINDNGNVIATTYDKDKNITRKMTKANEMWEIIDSLMNSNYEFEPDIIAEMAKVAEFIDVDDYDGGGANDDGDSGFDGGIAN